VKEKRKGPISIAGGLVDSVAATVRRMQRDREPRALAYDPTGYARLIQPDARGHERILEIAEEMVALASIDGGRAAREAAAEETAEDAAAVREETARPKQAKRPKQATKARGNRSSGSPEKPRARRTRRPKDS
jgi:hypothetical protein